MELQIKNFRSVVVLYLLRLVKLSNPGEMNEYAAWKSKLLERFVLNRVHLW